MLKFIFKRVKKQWSLLIISMVGLFVIAMLQFVIPQITQYIIDKVIPSGSPQGLIYPLIFLMIIAILLAILSFISSYLISIVSQNAIVDLRVDLYQHILKQDYKFFEVQKTGDLMTRFSDDIKTLQDLISPNTLKLLGNIFTFIFILSFMLIRDAKLTLLIAITFPVLFFLNRTFGKLIKKTFRKVRQSTALINNHLQTSLTSILLIKSFTSESLETDKFKSLNEDNRNNLIKATKYQSLFSPSIDIVNYIGMSIVLGYGALMVMKQRMSVGEVVSYIAYLKLLQSPMRDFSLMISRLQQALVSYDRISELYDTQPTITSKQNATKIVNFSDKVSLNNLYFSYDETQPILNDISFELQKGKTIALVGLSGSGKTTITKLITRLYEAQEGSIEVDGVNIKDLSIPSLRSNIGIVTQDIELIDGTIKENISYGQPGATDLDIKKAAKSANILPFIESLPDKFMTQVGQRGIRLSGGQKQRIAIARIFLKKSPILILDEATASLDNESEKYIQRALNSLMSNRTTLVIAHRLSTIQNADKIIVLEDGNIIESGTHQELMRNSQRYKTLYDAQFI